MPVNHNNFVLDQRTQRRNKDHDIAPFLCYDGDNMSVEMRKGEAIRKKQFPVRCWTGMGLIIYAGNGHMSIRGYSECMDTETVMAFDAVIKMAYQFITP